MKPKTNSEASTKPRETKQQILARLAARRVTKAIKAIGYCGNLAAYNPTEQQSEAIVSALMDAVQIVQTRMNGVKEQAEIFSLPGVG